MRSLNPSRRKREGGASMAEMAFTLPFLLVFLFGIIEFGLFFRTYHAVRNAAHVGGRVASLHYAGCSNGQVSSAVQTAVDAALSSFTLPNSVQPPAFPRGLCGSDTDGLVAVEISTTQPMPFLNGFFALIPGLTFPPELDVTALDVQRDFNHVN